jgi:hypothetical protein
MIRPRRGRLATDGPSDFSGIARRSPCREAAVVGDTAQIDLWQARSLLTTLRQDLQKIADRDPEQEVRGIAVPVLDAALSSIRELASDNAIVASVRDVISVEAIEEGEPVRAVDVLMVVTALLAVVPQPPVSLPRVAQREPRWPQQF